jgi:hypothetical protein
MNKPYHEMTPAERLASRIASNRVIEDRAQSVLAARQVVDTQTHRRRVGKLVRRLQTDLVMSGHVLDAINVGRIARGQKPIEE